MTMTGVDRRRAAEDADGQLKQLLVFLQSLGVSDARLVSKPRQVEINNS